MFLGKFDCFHNTEIKNTKFSNTNLTKFSISETIIDKLEFDNCVNFDFKNICKSINKGAFEEETIIVGSDAELYFLNKTKNL